MKFTLPKHLTSWQKRAEQALDLRWVAVIGNAGCTASEVGSWRLFSTADVDGEFRRFQQMREEDAQYVVLSAFVGAARARAIVSDVSEILRADGRHVRGQFFRAPACVIADALQTHPLWKDGMDDDARIARLDEKASQWRSA